jgi:hypothetical protein
MRWVIGALAVCSAVLCAAALVSWVRSYLPPHLHVLPHRGCLLIASMSASDELLANYGGADELIPVMTHFGTTYQHFAGFAYVTGRYGSISAFSIAAIPFWFIVLVTGMGPALWWCGLRRRRSWARHGRCRGCGYDLRATPGRCPECGAESLAADDAPTLTDRKGN